MQKALIYIFGNRKKLSHYLIRCRKFRNRMNPLSTHASILMSLLNFAKSTKTLTRRFHMVMQLPFNTLATPQIAIKLAEIRSITGYKNAE